MKAIWTFTLAFVVCPVWIITLLTIAVSGGDEDLIVGASLTGAVLCLWLGGRGTR